MKIVFALLVLLPLSLFAKFQHIDIKETQQLMKKGVPVIDIRTPPEWKETGVIPGAHKIMFFDQRGRYNVQKWLKTFSKVVKDKNQPFILVCHTANRTKMVGQFLDKQMGYKHVYDLKGGIDHWIRAHQKVVK